MKQINKSSAPQWFEQWKSDFVEVNNRQPHYKVDFAGNDSDGIERRRMLREALINEQGKICCYCMRRIYNNSAHIEHFFPQESFRDMDLTYENMFASCNGEATIILDDEIRSFIEYYSNKNNGEYEPYCKAIVDCLEEML